MKRHSPLERRTPIERRARLPYQNRERRASTRAKAFGPQSELCRTLPCAACGDPPPSDPAHVRSRGAGGQDLDNVVPLCRADHIRQHAHGWSRVLPDARRIALDIGRLVREIDASSEA